MRTKAFILIFALFLQPSFAVTLSQAPSPIESSWYQDPLLWVTIGYAAVFSYIFGEKFREGASRVLPALMRSTMFIATTATVFIFKKMHIPVVLAILPAVSMLSYFMYKSMITCPVKGTQGCCCGLSL